MEASEAGEQASDLPGHCLDSMPARNHSKSGSTLDKKAPEGLINPQGSSPKTHKVKQTATLLKG